LWLLGLAAVLALAACGGSTATSVSSLATPTATVAAPVASGAPAASSAPAASAAPSRAEPTRGIASPTAVAAVNPTPNATQVARIPGATATATAMPSAPPGPTAIPQPNGAIPAGWQVYRGTPEFPFVVAYPPGWTVDDSLLPDQRVVYLYGPDGRDDTPERIDIEISEIGDGANIDVQRDEFFRQESDFCDAKGIEYTEQRQVAGVAFAVLGATCDASDVLSFMQVASGLKHGDEWNILMRTPYDRKEARLREVFDPMLASFNVYAQIP
jgi:hypothetical protein